METIWLQRPSNEIPWGFRLQGGLEFDQPLSVQRVTPGSVAASGLTPGDVVLKIGNVNTTNISHTDAQDVIRGASNILQMTIRKDASVSPPASLTSGAPLYQNEQQTGYQPPGYNQQDKYQTLPDYKVGSGYDRSANTGGYSNELERHPYDTRPPDRQAMTGYSTLPVRGSHKQSNDGFRPVQPQDPQNKFAFKSTGGITLQMKPQVDNSASDSYQNSYGDRNGYNNPMSPVAYPDDSRSNPQTNRQTSVGSNCSDNNTPRIYFKNPTPFTPGGSSNQNERTGSPPRLQRQSSQGSNNVYAATISSTYNQPDEYIPPSDDAPPHPPPPANYRQTPSQYNQSPYEQDPSPVPSQRKSSLPAGYRQSPYDQRQPADPYSQRQQGIYVDTADTSGSSHQPPGPGYGSTPTQYGQPQPPSYGTPQPEYARQSSREQYDRRPSQQPQYNSRPPQQPEYNSRPPQEPEYNSRPPLEQYGRQSSREQQPQQPQQYGRHPSHDPYGNQAYNDPNYGRQAPQDNTAPQYGRPPSREQPNQYNQAPAYRNSPQAGSGINSFDEVLSPFENFQNSNYCDKLFSRPPNDADSGVISDYSSPAQGYPHSQSDIPRSGYSGYAPSQGYSGQCPPPGGPGMAMQNLLHPAPQAPPLPAVSPPPPPPPPPPPSDWTAPKQSFEPRDNNPSTREAGQEMPDKVLNTMLKHGGTQKPFSYMPTGMDLKKFKEKARQRNAVARTVMPKAYSGPTLDEADAAPSELQRPQAAKTRPGGAELDVQSGGSHDVSNVGGNNMSNGWTDYSDNPRFITIPRKMIRTPEKPSEDIQKSQTYKMVRNADSKGKDNGSVVPERSPSPLAADPDRKQSLTSRGKGLSFRVLQWLTDTVDDEENDREVESYKPKKARNPLLRHNSEDDEMRFSGLHSKADIPSKAFKILNRMATADAEAHAAEMEQQKQQQQQQQPKDEDNDDNRIGNYDEASIRYRGKYIPSPSFRLLQSMNKQDEEEQKNASAKGSVDGDEESNGLPEKLDDEDQTDRRYKGGNIPSRSFRALQMSVADDKTDSQTSEASESADSTPSKIKIVSRTKPQSPRMSPIPQQPPADPTPPQPTPRVEDNPITDF